MLLNGPESFTPDGNFILGEAPEVARLLRRRRLQLGGHRQRRRRRAAARRVDRRRRGADRPVGRRHPPLRRASTPTARMLSERTVETLGLHYAMRWPRQELESRAAAAPLAALRPARRERRALRLEDGLGAAQLFRSAAARRRRATGFGRPGWLPTSCEPSSGRRRERAAIFDQTSFGKFLLPGPRRAGRAAAPVRQRDRRRRRAGSSTPRCSTRAAASRAISR